MNTPGTVAGLAEEYRALFDDLADDSEDSITRLLTTDADWTPEAASHLLRLAREYGAFMLRNALAISPALDIEDGELGF